MWSGRGNKIYIIKVKPDGKTLKRIPDGDGGCSQKRQIFSCWMSRFKSRGGGAILGTVDSAISTIGRRLPLLVSTSNILTLDVQWRTASGLNDWYGIRRMPSAITLGTSSQKLIPDLLALAKNMDQTAYKSGLQRYRRRQMRVLHYLKRACLPSQKATITCMKNKIRRHSFPSVNFLT